MGVERRPRRVSGQTREHVLTVAGELFYRDGVRATGVDTVAARAGVAPPTLYRLFGTKDDLVAAYVERCSAAYRDKLSAACAESAGTVRERIRNVFDAFARDAATESCRGCPFLLVLAEYPDPGSPAHVQAVAHKTWVRSLLQSLVDELGKERKIADPARLAEQLTLVAEGIYGAAQALGVDGPAAQGPACADALIDAAGARKKSA